MRRWLEYLRWLLRRRSLAFACVAVMLAGCVRYPEPTPKPAPVPVSSVSEVADASATGYRNALAEEADRTADTAAKFMAWQPALDDWTKRNDAARAKHFKSLENSVNPQLFVKQKPDGTWEAGPYNPDKLAEVASEVANGFRK